MYNSTIKETPELLSYEAKRNDTESNSDIYNSNIAQNPQKVNSIADIKKEPRSEQYNDRSYIRKANSVLDNQGSAYGSNISQNTQEVNRMQPFEPIERTPLVNGDRDFGGSFGNGFDPRGENSAVNKAAFRKSKKKI